jgi:hypothetical protein
MKSEEWGQSHGLLLPDPNFAPTQWQRFEWGEERGVQGPEPEPTSWGRCHPKRSPSSSSSSFHDQHSFSSSSSNESGTVSFQLHDGETEVDDFLDKSSSHNSCKRLCHSSGTPGHPAPLPVISTGYEVTAADSRRGTVHRQIHLMNTSSVLNGETPHELVFDPRPSHMAMGSEFTSSGMQMGTSSGPRVTRRERSELLKKFRKEQKLDRRHFKLEVRETWEAEIAAEKENYFHENDPREDSSLPRFPVNPEDAAQAYEDYLFERMMRYDSDAAHLLVDFRASLQVVPYDFLEQT